MPEDHPSSTGTTSATPHKTQNMLLNVVLRLEREKETHPWLHGLNFHIADGKIHVSFIHKYFGKWFARNRRDEFEMLLRGYSESGNCLVEYEPTLSVAAFLADSKRNETANISSNSSQKDEFANFFAGAKNAAVLVAIKKALHKDSGSKFLGICGANGTGKSHLLKAIRCSLAEENSEIPVIGCKTDFLCEMFGTNPGTGLRTFRGNHIFVLDDMQDIAKNEIWQNIIAEYIDIALDGSPGCSRSNGDGRIFFSFSGTPEDIKVFSPRLRCRLESALIVELQEPDLDARLNFLENANRIGKLRLGRTQMLAMARIARIIPELQGMLRKIEFYSDIHGHLPEVDDLENIANKNAITSPAGWEEILARVAGHLGIEPEDILGKSRKPELVLARQLSMYMCRRRLGLSYPELGKLFGGKDHSTAIHAVKKIQSLADTDRNMHKLVEDLEKRVK